jgi:DNA repair exonuclease SbcCD ATPase subunit
VKGFQSLRDVDISLGKFTVILGESGTGKSAFIRSVLKFVRNDAVSGTSGGEPWSHLPPSVPNAEVDLSVDNHKLRWVKGRDNKYVIDGSPLSKVGKGCPDEVQDVLRMRELSFDGADKYHLNFAQQFDMPFLLDDSGSKVAKILGEITNVNILYAANREANARKTQASRTLTVRKEDLDKQTELLKEFVELPSKKRALAQMRELEAQMLEKVELYKQLFSYSTRILRLMELTADSQSRLTALAGMPAAAERVEALFEDVARYKSLTTIGMVLGDCRTTATQLGERAKKLNPLRKVDMTELDADLKRYAEMDGALVTLAYIESNVEELKEELDAAQGLADVDIASLSADVERYREMQTMLAKVARAADATSARGAAFAAAADTLRLAEEAYAQFVAENPLCPFCSAPLDAAHEEAHV